VISILASSTVDDGSLCLNFVRLLAQKPNLENNSIYSNNIFQFWGFGQVGWRQDCQMGSNPGQFRLKTTLIVYKIGILFCYFSAMHTALRSKSKVWLVESG